MRIIFKFCFVVLFFFLIVNVSCANLGKAKGTVINLLTNEPLSGVRVVARTSSGLESEQKYLTSSTSTDKNGAFTITGLRNKHYSIRIVKNGYTERQTGVTIPNKSSMLIKEPIKLCPLPPEKGLYVYSDKYIKLEKAKPYNLFIRNDIDFPYYMAEDLKNLRPINVNYIVFYGKEYADTDIMYWLFRRTNRENVGEAENNGDYYVVGDMHRQFAKTYASFNISMYYSNHAEFLRPQGDNRNNHIWGRLDRVYESPDPILVVFKVDYNIPRGYYLLGYENRFRNRMVGKDAYLLNLR